MKWNKHLTQLNDALGLLLPFREDVLPILAQSGINVSHIRFDPKPNNLWFSVLDYANRNGYLERLVEVLLNNYPENPYLKSFKDQVIYDLGEDIKNVKWKEELPKDKLERILGKNSTLLPIHFLSDGLKAAKCVARVVIPGHEGLNLGTGFLIDQNLFVTNNHVISTISEAEDAIIEFDFEEIRPGNPKLVVPFKLNPGSKFLTSIEDDWTIVKIDGDANIKYGFLNLNGKKLELGEHVNIIQHPGGRYKQIGLYRNVVTYIDARTIQYLTDTEPGSSGSPVFNSKWEVVALHNSSGAAKEAISSDIYMRNQGIVIQKIIAGLQG